MQPEATSGGPLTPGIVFENLQAYQRTFALKAAIELDIFRAVGQGPGDVASIARHASASERGTRILCDFLVISGLLQKVDGQYKHTPSSAAFLDPGSPHCLAEIAQFMSIPAMREPYENLAEVVRNGRTMAAAFSMTMLTSTVAGDAYTFSELSSMHGQAGFSVATSHPIPMSPHTIILASA